MYDRVSNSQRKIFSVCCKDSKHECRPVTTSGNSNSALDYAAVILRLSAPLPVCLDVYSKENELQKEMKITMA